MIVKLSEVVSGVETSMSLSHFIPLHATTENAQCANKLKIVIIDKSLWYKQNNTFQTAPDGAVCDKTNCNV